MFEQINSQITGLLGPAGPLIVVAGLAVLLILATIPMMLTLHPYSVRRAMRPILSYVFAVELRSHDVQFHGLCP